MTDALLAQLIRALDLVAIERQHDHTFHAITPEPAWFTRAFAEAEPGARQTLAGAFPFLDDVLQHALGAWKAGPHASIVTGPFSIDVAGESLLLRVTALTVEGRAVLVLERMVGAADARPILQKARERMLEGETLTRQVTQVHAPAQAIAAAVDQLAAASTEPAQQPIIDELRVAVRRLLDALAPLPAPPARRR